MNPYCSICQADTVIGVNSLGFCVNHVENAVVASIELAQAIRRSIGREPLSIDDIILIEELNDE